MIRRILICIVPVLSWATDTEIRFRAERIQTQPAGAVSVADIDGDGKPDIFTAAPHPAWLQNPGWKRRELAGSEGNRARASLPAGPQFGWINGVRHLAVFETAGLVIYEQPVQPFRPQDPTLARPRSVADGTWKRTVAEPGQSVSSLLWVDLDDDGSDEVVTASASGVVVFRRRFGGTWESVRVPVASAGGICAGDLNGDGLQDLIISSEDGVRILWNETERRWVRHVIVSGFRTQSAVTGDFSGNGRLDVISGDIENDRRIFLYSAPDWKPTLLYSGIRLIQSAALDVDGDGDLDFIGAQYRPGRIFWLEHPARPLQDPWPIHFIDEFSTGGVNGVHGLLLADVDADGRLDLVANSGWTDGSFPNSLAWFRIPREPRKAPRWERYMFADRDAPGLSHYLGAGDVNGDGKLDLASAAKIGPAGNWFAWWEQGKDPRKPWTKHVIATGQEGATNILMADINGDAKTDFMASRGHGHGLVWYEAPGWKPHEIYPSLAGPHALAAGDIDGDGDVDFVTCAKDAHIVAWLENDGRGNFTIHHIYEDQAAYEVRLIDMDGDGDLDLLVAGQESQNVVWFENRLRSSRL